MKKIIILGATASGKTTLANKMGEILGISVHHLDKIAWKENGIFASQAEIMEKLEKIMRENNSWIIDGGMPRSKTLDTRISNADTIIFYDLPVWLCLWRQFRRFFKYYNKVRPDMGGNNKQKYPFTWKEIKYTWKYPTKDIYSKLEPYMGNKNIIVLKNKMDEINFLSKIKKI